MNFKTRAGMVQSIGEIWIEEPGDLPEFLQNFRYVIFEEAEDMLGLIYHAVCIDLELDARGATPKEAYRGLKNSIHSLIEVTLSHASDKTEAYAAFKEQINNMGSTRELANEAYLKVLIQSQNRFMLIYGDLHKHIFSKFQEKVIPEEVIAHEFAHFFIRAPDYEEIENPNEPQQISDKIMKQAVSLNYLLVNNMVRQKNKGRA